MKMDIYKHPISLNEKLTSKSEEEYIDLIIDNTITFTDEIIKNNNDFILKKLINDYLTPLEQKVVNQFYFENKNGTSIAKELNVTQQNIAKVFIEQKIKLKKLLNNLMILKS